MRDSSRLRLGGNKQYVSQQQVQRRLIRPDETMRLLDEDALIFVAGHPPIRATKISYYEDQIWGGYRSFYIV